MGNCIDPRTKYETIQSRTHTRTRMKKREFIMAKTVSEMPVCKCITGIDDVIMSEMTCGAHDWKGWFYCLMDLDLNELNSWRYPDLLTARMVSAPR